LDVRDGQVVKGVQFRNHEIIGDIVPLAQRYAQEGADELVRVGFDNDEARFFAGYFFDEQVGGFVEAAFEGAEGAGNRVPAADGAVVGVGDCDGSVGQLGQAEGVLHAGGVGVAVDEAEVEQALADGRGDLYAVFGEGDVAQAAGFGACDPEAAVGGCAEAACGRPVPSAGAGALYNGPVFVRKFIEASKESMS